jgi:hypothetical protein
MTPAPGAGDASALLARARADRALAEAAFDAENTSMTFELARGSARDAEAAGAPLDAALALMLVARALAYAGHVQGAAREVERAAELFASCGAEEQRERAEAELRRLGRPG